MKKQINKLVENLNFILPSKEWNLIPHKFNRNFTSSLKYFATKLIFLFCTMGKNSNLIGVLKNAGLFAITTVSMIVLIVVNAYGTDDLNLTFEEANSLYDSGDYSKSFKLYSSLVEDGVKNPLLYYNTANTCMRLDPPKLANAILYYKMALLYDRSNESVINNLVLARSMVKSQHSIGTKDDNRGFIYNVFEYVSYIFSIDNITIIITLTLTIIFILISVYLLRRKKSRAVFVSFVVSIIMLVMFLVVLFVRYHYEINLGEGVIMNKETKAYSSASENSESVLVLYKGSEVKIKKIVNYKWLCISLPEGLDAYVLSESVALVNSFLK